MIRDETNQLIAGQYKVPNSESDRESTVSPPENSLYENNTNIINQNEEAYFINSIDNEDLFVCTESGGLINYSPSASSFIAFPQDINLSQSILNISEAENENTNDTKKIDELPNAMPDRKVFPNLEEHDNGNLQFELNLEPNKTELGKNNWYYSKILNKVFIRMDKPFYIDVVYLPKIQDQLYLRMMIVYVEDMGSPVTRCNNHLCKDKTVNENERHSVVRCENNDVSYIGTVHGKNCDDRLTVLTKLNFVQPIDGICKQSIKLTFVCQNSCIGRKTTAVIFLLETSTQILGKRVVNVKVCSCPKRDKKIDEENVAQKRNAEQAGLLPSGKRPAKILKIKEEPGINVTQMISDKPDATSQLSKDFLTPTSSAATAQKRENGTIRLSADLPNPRIVRRAVDNMFDMVAGEMAKDPENSEKNAKCLRDLKRLRDSL